MGKLTLPCRLQGVALALIFLLFRDVCAFPEQGKWTYDINQETKFIGVFKSLFANSSISFNSM